MVFAIYAPTGYISLSNETLDKSSNLLRFNLPKGRHYWHGAACQQPEYDTMVYIEHGHAYFRSTAFLHVVKHFGALWPLLGLGRIVPRMIRDWLYDRIALNRYRLFGQRELCFMPTPQLISRFVLE